MSFKSTSFFVLSLISLTILGMENSRSKSILTRHEEILVTAFLNEKFKPSYESTTFADRKYYAFHGIKIPIYELDITRSSPGEKVAGNVIKGAKPSAWCGITFDETALPSDRIFLNTGYQAQIQTRKNEYAIRCSCLIVGKSEMMLAFLWRDLTGDPRNLYITMAQISHMQENQDILDIDKNKKFIGNN